MEATNTPTDVQQAVELAKKKGPVELAELIQDLEYASSKATMAVRDAREALKKCPEVVALHNLEANEVTHEAMLDAVKGMMLDMLNDNGLESVTVKTGEKFSVRTTPGALEIVDEAKLREMRGDLFVEKLTVSPDKKAIKAEVEAGHISTDWAYIKKTQSLSVTKPA